MLEGSSPLPPMSPYTTHLILNQKRWKSIIFEWIQESLRKNSMKSDKNFSIIQIFSLKSLFFMI